MVQKRFFFFFTIHKRGKILNTSVRVQSREKEVDGAWPGLSVREETEDGE